MYNVYYDQGTTNGRIYLIKDEKVIYTAKGNVGSKDVSITGENKILIGHMKKLYDEMLQKEKIQEEEIEGIYASGMITSPYGIKEVPHMSTPVTLKKMVGSISTYYEETMFKRKIHLIRGVKTIPQGFKPDSYSIEEVNNMRGEEIEIIGIMSKLPKEYKKSCAIVMPGSHTHIVYIKEGAIEDILSTFSGELYHAITHSTILSSSVKTEKEGLQEEMVKRGYEVLKKYGFNRALYIAHAMKVFDANDNYKRKSFLEGIITGGVVQAFEKISCEKWDGEKKVVIAGTGKIAKAYEILLKENVKEIQLKNIERKGKGSYASDGMIEILKEVKKR